MKSIETYAKIEAGKLHISYRDRFMEAIAAMPEGRYRLRLERIYNKRTLLQNGYYWAVVVPMVQDGLLDAGYKVNKEQTHEFLKATFNKKEIVNEQTGEILQTVGSTAENTTVEMMEYYAEITRWSAEFLNIEIPEPNEQMKIF